jgi:PKD repeat protein
MSNRHLLLLSLASLIITTVASADIQDGLIAWYPFNGNCADSSGNGNHGTAQGNLTYPEGIGGQSAEFDGTDDHIVIPNFPADSSYTITFWATQDTVATGGWVFSTINHCPTTVRYWAKGQLALSSHRNLTYVVSQTVYCSGGWNNDRYGSSYNYAQDSIPLFVVMTVEENYLEERDLKLYVNNQEVLIGQTADQSSESAFNPAINYITTIGAFSTVPGYISPYTGILDEFRIYDRILNSSERQELYMQNTPLPAAFSASATIVLPGAEIQFSDTTNGSPTNWEWDFQNDGEVDSYEQNPVWTYNDPGYYSVALTVADGVNSNTIVKDNYINISAGEYTLAFDGVTDYVLIQDYPSIFPESGFTIEGWIKPDSLLDSQSSGTVMAKYNWNSRRSLSIHAAEEILYTTIFDGVNVVAQVYTNRLRAREWHHFAISYSADFQLNLTLNGTLVDSDRGETAMYISGVEAIYLGNAFSAGQGSNNHYHGEMDEVRIWDHVRSDEDIIGQMHEPLSGREDGLLAYYRFREGSGTTTESNSLSGNGGTLQGAPDWTTSTAPSPLVLGTMANFTANRRIGEAPFIVQFTDLSVSPDPITSWEWDFDNDDNIDSYETNPSWVFETPGYKTITLTVSTGDASDTEVKVDFIQDPLVAYYPFNGNANDESRTGNNGTVEGATLIPDRFGHTESAYNFDGSAHIDCGNNFSLDLTDALTITLWANSSPDNINSTLIAKENGQIYSVQYDYGTDQMTVSINGNLLSVPWGLSGEWGFLATTYDVDEGQLNLYRNGVLLDQLSYNIPLAISGGALQIGRELPDDSYFSGDLDDIRIYRRALTDDEILNLYQENVPAAPLNLQIEALSMNSVCITWNTVPEATSYQVYSTTDPYLPSNRWSLEAEGITSTFWDDLNPGEGKFYHVTAISE